MLFNTMLKTLSALPAAITEAKASAAHAPIPAPNVWNPDAYNAAFLSFKGLLPTALSQNLPEALYNATAFALANPVPLPSFEFMGALNDAIKVGGPVLNFEPSILASMTPEVLAWAIADMQPTQPLVYAPTTPDPVCSLVAPIEMHIGMVF